MAIDARIAGVTVIAPIRCETCNMTGKHPENGWDDCPRCYGAANDNPVVNLNLEPRKEGGSPGQSVLTIIDPPTVDPSFWAGMIGTEIWGGAGYLMVGDKKWADRIGYTLIKLVEPLPKPPAVEGES